MGIGDRIRQEREAQSVSRAELARFAGIAPTTLSDIELGYSKNTTALHKIATRLGVRVEWLETGKGAKHAAAQSADDPDWRDIKATTQGVALGDGAAPEDYVEAHQLKFRANSLRGQGLKEKNLEVYYGRGDSMEPRIKDGDAILVNKAETRIVDDNIYFIRHEGHYFVKRLQKHDEMIFIVSDNKENPQWRKPLLVRPGDDFEVIGRVRWIGSWEA